MSIVNKDVKLLNTKIDKSLYDEFIVACDKSRSTKTEAVEKALKLYIDSVNNPPKEIVIEKDVDEFTPYLIDTLSHNKCGVIGTKTLMKDCDGYELCIGDTVNLFDYNHFCLGEYCVLSWRNDVTYIDGIKGDCHKDGSIDKRWLIKICRSYENIPDKELVSFIKYIKSE